MDQETATQPPKTEEESIEEQIISAQPTIELKPASNRNKILIVGIIILIIIGVAYYFLVLNKDALNMFNAKPTQVTVVPTPTVAETAISDPQIDKDIQALNNKITGLDTDFSSIDNGLNDKQVDIPQ